MLKHIVLHGPAVDNAGNFKDAGSELTVGAAEKENHITAERAQQLIDQHAAVSRTAAEQQTRAPNPAKKVAAKKVAPKAVPAPPAPEPEVPAAASNEAAGS